MATYGAATNTPGMEATTTCWQNKSAKSFVDDLWDREGSGAGRFRMGPTKRLFSRDLWNDSNFDLQINRGTFDCLSFCAKKGSEFQRSMIILGPHRLPDPPWDPYPLMDRRNIKIRNSRNELSVIHT